MRSHGEVDVVEAPTAGAIVGALADDNRRLVFAAVELGAEHVDAVVDTTGLSGVQVAKALGKLVSTGLVSGGVGRLSVSGDVFQRAARAALARPVVSEHDAISTAARKVMNAFVSDGRLRAIPTSHTKRLIILDWLVQGFDPGRRYTEAMVNLILGQRHPDTAALRRYLVDEGYLDRAAGEYWRSGGTVAG